MARWSTSFYAMTIHCVPELIISGESYMLNKYDETRRYDYPEIVPCPCCLQASGLGMLRLRKLSLSSASGVLLVDAGDDSRHCISPLLKAW